MDVISYLLGKNAGGGGGKGGNYPQLPGDATRYSSIDELTIANSVADANGNITYQELLRSDNTLAIKREASNPTESGYYQTYVETFYLADGTTVNYVDTYNFTYSDSGAILTKTFSTTEEV